MYKRLTSREKDMQGEQTLPDLGIRLQYTSRIPGHASLPPQACVHWKHILSIVLMPSCMLVTNMHSRLAIVCQPLSSLSVPTTAFAELPTTAFAELC